MLSCASLIPQHSSVLAGVTNLNYMAEGVHFFLYKEALKFLLLINCPCSHSYCCGIQIIRNPESM